MMFLIHTLLPIKIPALNSVCHEMCEEHFHILQSVMMISVLEYHMLHSLSCLGKLAA